MVLDTVYDFFVTFRTYIIIAFWILSYILLRDKDIEFIHMPFIISF
jgi:hypothetical protein